MCRTFSFFCFLIVSMVFSSLLIGQELSMDGLEATAEYKDSASAEQYLDQIEALLDEVEREFGGRTKTVKGFSEGSKEWTTTFRGWSEQLEELWKSFQKSVDERLAGANDRRGTSFSQATAEVERRYKSHFSQAGPEPVATFNELVQEAERERNNLRVEFVIRDQRINLVKWRQFNRLPETTSWNDIARRRLVSLLPKELIDAVNHSLEEAYDDGFAAGNTSFSSFGAGSAHAYHFVPFERQETVGQLSEQLVTLAERASQALAQMDDFRATYEQDLSYKKGKMFVSRSLSEEKRDEMVARYRDICEGFAKAMEAYEKKLRLYLKNYPGEADEEAKRGLEEAWEGYESSQDFQFIHRYAELKERAESYNLVRSGVQRNLRLARAPRWRNEKKALGSAEEAIELLPDEMKSYIEKTRDRAEASGYSDGQSTAAQNDGESSLF